MSLPIERCYECNNSIYDDNHVITKCEFCNDPVFYSHINGGFAIVKPFDKLESSYYEFTACRQCLERAGWAKKTCSRCNKENLNAYFQDDRTDNKVLCRHCVSF